MALTFACARSRTDGSPSSRARTARCRARLRSSARRWGSMRPSIPSARKTSATLVHVCPPRRAAMHIGLSMFPTDYAIEPHHLAREAEARGFESLWLPEHTHIPASRRTPYPGGTELPKEYWHTFDP